MSWRMFVPLPVITSISSGSTKYCADGTPANAIRLPPPATTGPLSEVGGEVVVSRVRPVPSVLIFQISSWPVLVVSSEKKTYWPSSVMEGLVAAWQNPVGGQVSAVNRLSPVPSQLTE